MHFYWYKLKLLLARLTNRVADVSLFLGLVLIGGLGTSWYMVEAGSAITTHSIGPWVTWKNAARADADPYTRAHIARLGTMPLSTDIARTYVARTDSAGNRLHSSCEYVIEGEELSAHWWSLTAFDDRGALIPNIAGRHSFTSQTMTIAPDGRFMLTMARDARPGNWLPTGGAGRIALVLEIVDGRVSSLAASAEGDAAVLPEIRQVQCR